MREAAQTFGQASLIQAMNQAGRDMALATLQAELDGLTVLFQIFAGSGLLPGAAQEAALRARPDDMMGDELMENVPL